MCASSYYITIVSLKTISAEFGWPRSFTSAAYSILFLGMGIGGIFMGWWSDRIGVALPAAIGIVFTAIGTVVAGTSQGFITFLIAHGILMGLLGNSALFVPLLANITHWFDRRRGPCGGHRRHRSRRSRHNLDPCVYSSHRSSGVANHILVLWCVPRLSSSCHSDTSAQATWHQQTSNSVDSASSNC